MASDAPLLHYDEVPNNPPPIYSYNESGTDGGTRTQPYSGGVCRKAAHKIDILKDFEVVEGCCQPYCVSTAPCLCPSFDAERGYVFVRENSVEFNYALKYACCLASEDHVKGLYFDTLPFRGTLCCHVVRKPGRQKSSMVPILVLVLALGWFFFTNFAWDVFIAIPGIPFLESHVVFPGSTEIISFALVLVSLLFLKQIFSGGGGSIVSLVLSPFFMLLDCFCPRQSSVVTAENGCMCCCTVCNLCTSLKARVVVKKGTHRPIPCCCMLNKVNSCDNCCGCFGPISGNPIEFENMSDYGMPDVQDAHAFVDLCNRTHQQIAPRGTTQ
eukprot:m.44445 g.44445  ORF g.44445 m.44445 type:complete len:327 (+) comp19680_c0_seq1:138-1118(+)